MFASFIALEEKFMKKVTGFSISEDVIEKIDEKRGLAARSAVVEDILRKGLGLKKEVVNG